MNAIQQNTLEQEKPFAGLDHALLNLGDLKSFQTKVISKSDNRVYVLLPNDDAALLRDALQEEHTDYTLSKELSIYYDPEGNAYKDNGEYVLYSDVLSKALKGEVFNGKIINATSKGFVVSIDGLQAFLPNGQIGEKLNNDPQSYIGHGVNVKLINFKLNNVSSG